tara:strand:- start:310 stop:612 length:303 start_codon:yes stop_codon:yes gene_type:complete
MPDGNLRKLLTFRLARSALLPSEKASCHRHPTLCVEMTLFTELSLSSQFDLQPHTANLTPHPAPVAPLADPEWPIRAAMGTFPTYSMPFTALSGGTLERN